MVISYHNPQKDFSKALQVFSKEYQKYHAIASVEKVVQSFLAQIDIPIMKIKYPTQSFAGLTVSIIIWCGDQNVCTKWLVNTPYFTSLTFEDPKDSNLLTCDPKTLFHAYQEKDDNLYQEFLNVVIYERNKWFVMVQDKERYDYIEMTRTSIKDGWKFSYEEFSTIMSDLNYNHRGLKQLLDVDKWCLCDRYEINKKRIFHFEEEEDFSNFGF